MTLDEIAVAMGTDKASVYGMIRFLEAKKLVQTTGTRRRDGVRGKGVKLYALKAGAADEVTALLSNMTLLPTE